MILKGPNLRVQSLLPIEGRVRFTDHIELFSHGIKSTKKIMITKVPILLLSSKFGIGSVN